MAQQSSLGSPSSLASGSHSPLDVGGEVPSSPISEAEPLGQDSLQRSLWQDSLNTVILLTLGIACVWILYLVLRDDMTPLAWLAPFGLLFAGITCYTLASRRPALARLLFPFTLGLILALFLWLKPYSLAPFLVVPIVLIAGLVASQWTTLALAAGLLAMLGLLGWLRAETSSMVYTVAGLTLTFTALLVWLSARNLEMVLGWAMFSQEQAYRTVNELRERRAALRQLSDMLHNNQERLHYLNISLEQAKVAAEEAYRTKQHFVANVSHELRTPLNLITGFSEMMAFSPESYDNVRLPPEYQEDIMEIYRSSKHLLSLVEDVLALAQLEAGQMIVHRDWADLSSVVTDVVETMRPLVEAKRIRLSVSIPPRLPAVYIDAGRIRQILLNLLNNAFRYTDQGEIAVLVRTEGQEVIVEVRDSGVGIAEEDLPHIFDQFSNLSRPPARRDGFGLGLSISRSLAEAHGGRMWATSVLGQGSTFALSLPLTTSDTPSRPVLIRTLPHPFSERSKPVVLAIDSGQGYELLERHLTDYRVIRVASEEVLEACEQYQPIAIWINASPSDDPAHAFEPLMPQLPPLPVIRCYITSLDDVAHRLRADFAIAKPVNREKILDLIARLATDRPVTSIEIIDDDPRMVRLLQRALTVEDSGYRVIAACGGQEGLELLAKERPDVVVLDLIMPGVSGYDILETLHRQPEYAKTRIILITGAALDEDLVPVYTISVQNAKGFSLLKSVAVIKSLIETLSIKRLAI